MLSKKSFVDIDESYSLIVQAVSGCTYGKCTFCPSKNYGVRDYKDIIRDLARARDHYDRIDRIFISDGDSLTMDREDMVKILRSIDILFPDNKEVNIYANPETIMDKDIEDLRLLHEKGLTHIYMGLESGSERVLYNMDRGLTREDLTLAGKKVKHVGINLCTRVVIGLGGLTYSKEHSLDTASLLSEIKPDKIILENLSMEELLDISKDGDLKMLTPRELLLEISRMIEAIDLEGKCSLESRRAVDGAFIQGELPMDRSRLLNEIEEEIESIWYKGEDGKRI